MKISTLKTQERPFEKRQNKPAFKGLGNISYAIQSNTLMNRAFLSVFGFTIPFAVNANNNIERKERLINSAWYTGMAFLSPIIMLPFINKRVLRKSGIIIDIKDKGVDILKVSKGYLNKDEHKMLDGMDKHIEKLKNDIDKISKQDKKLAAQKDLVETKKAFDNIKERHPDKEKLRTQLIDCHKNIFKWDFLTTSVAITANMWISNLYTRLTTGRKGYSGEFEMAGENYTDKQSNTHEKNRYKKMAASMVLAAAPAFVIPGFIAKSMKKNPTNLKGLSKWVNENAGKFDYKDAKYMSLLTYATMWTTGDYPTFFLACRDKHELKYKVVSFSILGAFYFAGDRILNSIAGRAIEKTNDKIKIMERKGYEKAGFMKKLFMPLKPLEEIGKKSRKYAMAMYWGNLALTAAVLGIGIPKTLNAILKQDVNADISKQNKTKIPLSKEAQDIFKDFLKAKKNYSH